MENDVTTLNETAEVTEVEPVSNGAENIIEMQIPYRMIVTIEGVTDLLLNGWNIEALEEKANSPKGSAIRKTDNPEDMVYRNRKGQLCLKGDCLKAAMREAGRAHQDPRSPRKSARDIINESIMALDDLTPILKGKNMRPIKKWDYIAAHRVVPQKGSAITRKRPAIEEGWRMKFEMICNAPEYFKSAFVQQLIMDAGKFKGLGDYRPTYGRFNMVGFEITQGSD